VVVTEAAARNQGTLRRTEMLRDTLRSSSSLSRRAALGGVGAVAAAVGLSHVDRTAAQEATLTILADHPIVGAWLLMNPGDPPSPSPMIFSADGTFSATGVPSYIDPQRGVVFGSSTMGVWEPTGERSVHVTWVQVLSDGNGTYLGTFTLDGYPEVSADGQSWDDEGTQVHFTIRDASNAIVMEAGGGNGAEPATPPVHAIRMQVGNPGFPEGTPAAGTPTG
jgi:hypothetical protein